VSETMETYDDGNFVVIKTSYGLYKSLDRDGKGLTCGIDKEAVIFWSREHLNGYQNSWVSVTDTSASGGNELQ